MEDTIKSIRLINADRFPFGYFKYVLKVTSDKIKYDYFGVDDYFNSPREKKETHWSKTIKTDYEKEIRNNIFEAAKNVDLLLGPDLTNLVTDGGDIILEIKYESGKKEESFPWTGWKIEPYHEGHRHIASLILELIPKGKETPDFITHQTPKDVCEWKIEELIDFVKPYIGKIVPDEIRNKIKNELKMGIEADYFYQDKMDMISEFIAHIDTLGFDNLRTLITCVFNSVDETIEKFISSGALSRTLKRILKLCNDENEQP